MAYKVEVNTRILENQAAVSNKNAKHEKTEYVERRFLHVSSISKENKGKVSIDNQIDNLKSKKSR